MFQRESGLSWASRTTIDVNKEEKRPTKNIAKEVRNTVIPQYLPVLFPEPWDTNVPDGQVSHKMV
jgi:hypothetical protein